VNGKFPIWEMSRKPIPPKCTLSFHIVFSQLNLNAQETEGSCLPSGRYIYTLSDSTSLPPLRHFITGISSASPHTRRQGLDKAGIML
jgi:hypothetical protein